MTQYMIRRVLLAIPTLLLMLTVVFVLVRLVPGDAAIAILGDQASAESLAAMRSQLGLDQPIHVQYIDFLAKAATGDFGRSLATGRSVLQEVAVVLPYTLELTAAALVIVMTAARNRPPSPRYLHRRLSMGELWHGPTCPQS